MVEAERPDAVLMDLGLPDRSGLIVGREIIEAHPEIAVVALTALEAPRIVEEALRAGFRAFITKDTSVAAFARAVRTALEGRTMQPSRFVTRRVSRPTPSELLTDQLTNREREVLALLVEGVSSSTIADRLGISSNTVRTHVQSILTKLQVHSRLEAATFALRHGIVEPLAVGTE